MSFWRKTTEMKCLSQYNVSRTHPSNLSLIILTLITWKRQHILGFWFLYPFFFLYCTLWKPIAKSIPHVRSGNYVPASQGQSSYINCLELYTGDLSLPHLFFSFNPSFISVWTQECLYFILWFIIQYYFIDFLAQIVSALATGSSCSWL